MLDFLKPRWRSLAELIGFVTILFGTKALVDPLTWQFSGPISMIFTLIVLGIYLRLQNEQWSELGLRPLFGWKAKLLLLPQAIVGMAGIIGFSAMLLLLAQHMGWTDFMEASGVGAERWGDLKGNLGLYLLWLLVVWTSAAFGEEIFFRGFFISRAQRLFDGVPHKWILSALFAAVTFGYAHYYYQGLRGFVVTGIVAFWLGLLYFAYKRNLWPLILAHGFVDSLMFTAHFMDWDI
ncbi:hypothetical protein ATL17_1429 [Maritalea mobilis]|uniref:CAAX prenyl protease 2/Lysostaphin resistance protein A-like domain-containing protein n=1 Tax=Maritalea mobilis TaxID=483324 RepID=A0A4R6VWZ8_9HYPH|nr:CPBP family intramembrane glutamic endopeptidase [Maritalea mobilis]TDQ67416.1 hypothetical protein ATL17_1429 [Maritalea mobilis]